MSWKHSPPKTSLPCNGDLIRFLRRERGWTQKRLAAASGYSERLIGKVEAGQPVHPDTVEIIAEALSTSGAVVHPEDLCVDVLSVVRPFVEGFITHGRRLVPETQHLFDVEVVADIPGDPDALPFAGRWSTIDGMDRYINTVYDAIDTVEFKPRFYAVGSDVFVYGTQTLRAAGGGPLTEFWGFVHYEVRRGKIAAWRQDFDADLFAQMLSGPNERRKRAARKPTED